MWLVYPLFLGFVGVDAGFASFDVLGVDGRGSKGPLHVADRLRAWTGVKADHFIFAGFSSGIVVVIFDGIFTGFVMDYLRRDFILEIWSCNHRQVCTLASFWSYLLGYLTSWVGLVMLESMRYSGRMVTSCFFFLCLGSSFSTCDGYLIRHFWIGLSVLIWLLRLVIVLRTFRVALVRIGLTDISRFVLCRDRLGYLWRCFLLCFGSLALLGSGRVVFLMILDKCFNWIEILFLFRKEGVCTIGLQELVFLFRRAPCLVLWDSSSCFSRGVILLKKLINSDGLMILLVCKGLVLSRWSNDGFVGGAA